MLPKNKLRKNMLSRLKLFTEENHTYMAQKPELIK
jgi:large subunit ribosomal protein L13